MNGAWASLPQKKANLSQHLCPVRNSCIPYPAPDLSLVPVAWKQGNFSKTHDGYLHTLPLSWWGPRTCNLGRFCREHWRMVEEAAVSIDLASQRSGDQDEESGGLDWMHSLWSPTVSYRQPWVGGLDSIEIYIIYRNVNVVRSPSMWYCNGYRKCT